MISISYFFSLANLSASSKFSLGTINKSAFFLTAPDNLNSTPPISSTLPLMSIVPVPTTVFPLVKSSPVRASYIARLKIRPPLGPLSDDFESTITSYSDSISYIDIAARPTNLVSSSYILKLAVFILSFLYI